MIKALFLGAIFAGDIMPAKTVLQSESYVLSIEEAEKLKAKIEDLEKKEKLLSEYINLENLREKQVSGYKQVVEFQDLQIEKYNIVISSKDKQIKTLLKRSDNSFLKNAILFSSGALLTAGSIYAADKLDDSIEK